MNDIATLLMSENMGVNLEITAFEDFKIEAKLL